MNFRNLIGNEIKIIRFSRFQLEEGIGYIKHVWEIPTETAYDREDQLDDHWW